MLYHLMGHFFIDLGHGLAVKLCKKAITLEIEAILKILTSDSNE